MIPPKANARFVWQMEQVLDLYEEAYDPRRPLVCFDERPCQLLGHVRDPIPMQADRPRRIDHEYKRNGTCHVLMAFEPLRGWRRPIVTRRRRKIEFAEAVAQLAEEVYPEAERIRLVVDNLNTHTPAAFYERFPPEKARSLTRRIEFIYTPKHGSWLNMVEIELSAFVRQCLDRRIESIEALEAEAKRWAEDRNQLGASVDWRFRTGDARGRLRKLYPLI